MHLTEEQRAAIVAASMQVKESLDAVFTQHGLHSMQVIWVEKDPQEMLEKGQEIASASFAYFGCPTCGGNSLAFAVKDIPTEMQTAFVSRFLELSGDKSAVEKVNIPPVSPTVN